VRGKVDDPVVGQSGLLRLRPAGTEIQGFPYSAARRERGHGVRFTAGKPEPGQTGEIDILGAAPNIDGRPDEPARGAG
jgi:hypothetical protein